MFYMHKMIELPLLSCKFGGVGFRRPTGDENVQCLCFCPSRFLNARLEIVVLAIKALECRKYFDIIG